MIARDIQPCLLDAFRVNPVVTITGPRQSGKTFLARSAFPELSYRNLERPDTRAYAEEDPNGFLAELTGPAIIDEIQRVPSLLSYIQVQVDEEGANGRFILTGSRQLGMMEAITQSLAGRTALVRLLPLSVHELTQHGLDFTPTDLLFRGLYPRIWDQHLDPTIALGDYFETYAERDVRQVSEIRNLKAFQRFVRLCAGRVGQLLNLSSLSGDAGVSHTTASHWLSVLEASYIIHRLEPWHANIRKRLVRTPKLYFHDVGLATYLLGIEDPTQLATHPLRGGLFENLVVSEVLKARYNRGRRSNLHFYRDHTGNEVDLLYQIAQHVLPIEVKSGQTVARDAFKGFKALDQIIDTYPHGRLLVYGGEREERRSEVTVTTIGRLYDRLP